MINIDKLVQNFFKGKGAYLSFQYYSDRVFNALNSIFSRILNRLDLHYLLDSVTTSVREIILNAIKANAKRIFFEKEKLNINDLDDYQKGMVKFKSVITNIELFNSQLEESNLRISILIKKKFNGILIEISNNIPITEFEKERIQYRMDISRSDINFPDSFETVYDPSEGAGLGIMLIILLLENAGIPYKNFKINFEKKSINSTLLIPYKLKKNKLTSKVKDKILEEIETLPTFPEHILELKRMCNDSSVSIEEISEKVTIDPSLTAEVLRIANTAGFITAKRIENVNDAIIIIGLNNLASIISVAAAKKIIEKKYKRFELIWKHCVKTAFYARTIAILSGQFNIQDKVFISGLLHDIGKIVLLTVDSDKVDQIYKIVEDKQIRTPTIIEEVAIGISHSTIGALIAQKWNFPEFLIDSIQNHHSPFLSKNENINNIVYIADMICNIERQKSEFLFIESDILKNFHIKNENEFNIFHEKLKLKYNHHYSIVRPL